MKKCIFISFWIFKYCFYYSFPLLCHILLFGCWVFSIPSRCQTVWIQIRPNILTGLIWVQTVCNGYQQTTKVDPRARLGVKEVNTKLLVDTTFWLKPLLNITMFHTSPHIIQLTLFNLDTGSNCKDPHEIQHKVAFHQG